MSDLKEQFGEIDIYVFDQLLRGRIVRGMRILDAGCGGGRNLVFLLREGFDVCGADASPAAIEAVRALAAKLAPSLPVDAFRVEPVERMSFADASADVVIASAVLHFARDDAHFDAMLAECWRVLRPGGLFFARLASTAGLDGQLQALGDNRFVLPDGATRYLVDEARLAGAAAALGGELADPLKTTLVHGRRSMSTWVLRKVRA
ncbi:MAG: class I SAM-dependent methyltransferase [Candidatus Eisenbacteria bacterium]|uniref:Class I SAM-dependent methyltransferase n=1 Tax=Eiseniibacteriota bacterium TaxID=2212470 RepID=A0A933W8W1_UNCEI|nr:class I SAM-dependent methyltransferase [Candidatus Eisenbacteria bacterium]